MSGADDKYRLPTGEVFKMLPVGIVKSEEYWNTLCLEDGAVLKFKTTVVRARRSVDKPVPGTKGEPLYHIETQTVVVAEVIPDDVRIEEDRSA